MSRTSGTTVLDDPAVRIPATAVTFAGFRAWATSDRYPERGRFSFINGELYVDMSPEELDTHNKVKTEVSRTLCNLNEEFNLGEYFSDGTLVTNEAADLSTEPDGTFVTWRSYEEGRVRLTPRADWPGQYVELVGTPDWVLEVVSRSSVAKDTQVLRAVYHRAEVPEYWLIDARYDEVRFQILRRRRDRYVTVSPGVAGTDRRSSAAASSWSADAIGSARRWSYTLQVTPP